MTLPTTNVLIVKEEEEEEEVEEEEEEERRRGRGGGHGAFLPFDIDGVERDLGIDASIYF